MKRINVLTLGPSFIVFKMKTKPKALPVLEAFRLEARRTEAQLSETIGSYTEAIEKLHQQLTPSKAWVCGLGGWVRLVCFFLFGF